MRIVESGIHPAGAANTARMAHEARKEEPTHTV
jgi:hypothetical protein